MAKGEKIAAKFEAYVPGMENDSEFEAVSFSRNVPEAIKGDIKEVNKFRGVLIKEISLKYGVKPLGAVAVALGTRGLKRDLIKLMVQAAKGDLEKVATKYNVKYPEHELTVEKIQAIMASSKSTAQVAKELLAD